MNGGRIGIKETLRRIWLISANKIKPYESSQTRTQTQLIIVTDNCHTGVLHECAKVGLAISAGPFLFCKYFSICVEKS